MGLLAFGAYILWMALPSRLPALALITLVLAGTAAKTYVGNPVLVRSRVKLALKPEFVALAGILILATGLRFAGINQSLPYLDNPDEPTTVTAAIKMLQTGDLNPHFFRWPSLPFYTQFLLSIPQFLAGVSSGAYSTLNQIVPEGFYLIGRLLSATLGVGTVLVTYLIGRKLYGAGVGLLAALILTILPLHSEHSKYVTPDIMVDFFAALTLLFATYIYKSGERKWYLWAGVAAGLTTGSKYNVAVVLITIVLAHFLQQPESKAVKPQIKNLFLSLALAVGVFILTTPFIIFDLSGFLNELAFQVRHYTLEGHGLASEGDSWKAYLRYFYNEAFVNQAVIALGGGVLLALVRQRRADWLVLSFPAVGYLFFSSALVHFPRNLMPLLPPLAILSACFIFWLAGALWWLWKRLFGKGKEVVSAAPTLAGIIVVILFSALFVFSIQNSFLTTRYYLQPDTRREAGEWIVQNIPEGAQLRLERFTPYLSAQRYKGVNEQRPVGAWPLDYYRQQGYDYLVASSYEYRDLIASDPQAATNYRSIFQNATLVREFPGDSTDHPGPTIRIYKVQNK